MHDKSQSTLATTINLSNGDQKGLKGWVSQADLTSTDITKDALRSSLAGSKSDRLNQLEAKNSGTLTHLRDKCFPARHHCSFISFGAGAAQASSVKHFWLWKNHLTTDSTNTQPTRRGSKWLLRICIEMEILNMGCVYTKHNDNIRSDAPFRAPANRAVAKNLTIPLQPIRKTMRRMFWAPDELAGSTAT